MTPQTCGAPVERARAERRTALFEHEAYELLEAAGIRCPAHVFVPDGRAVTGADLARLGASRVVVKAVAPGLLHKTEIGGVEVVPAAIPEIEAAVARMRERLAGTELAGCLLAAFVDHDRDPGAELLASARWTAEFGPVVSLALGGVHAEFLSSQLRDEVAVSVVSPLLGLPAHLSQSGTAARFLTERMRGRPPRLTQAAFTAFMERLVALAGLLAPLGLGDCEMNPVVVSGGEVVALDALVTLREPAPETPARPLAALPALLRPASIAVVGVSDHLNPGRIILRNLLREGTPPGRITVVKPGHWQVEGCQAVPSVRALPAPVDLLVVAVAAAQACEVVEDAIAGGLARSIVLIPGGFEEKAGSAPLAARIRDRLDSSRRTPSGGPLLVGGNCLGIRSQPGHYDTMFIPEDKLPPPQGASDPLAMISQSGAFAIARLSHWTDVRPRYVITTGNQLDVTIGDLLSGLAHEDGLEVFAVYVEGFKPQDGARALEAVRSIVARGRSVVIYRAGRTPAGAGAAASHTASMAGDYRLTHALFRQAGAMVAGTIDEFDDFVRLAIRLSGRTTSGARVGAVSNAGFECVALADAPGALSFPAPGDRTRRVVAETFRRMHVEQIVDVHNPLDLTPMARDEDYEAIVRAVLADPEVDLAVVGCIPLTSALHTLPGACEGGGLDGPDGIAARLGRVWDEGGKPWVVVVDSGPLFDPLAAALAAHGIPVFRAADRAIRALDAWHAARRPSVSCGRAERGLPQ